MDRKKNKINKKTENYSWLVMLMEKIINKRIPWIMRIAFTNCEEKTVTKLPPLYRNILGTKREWGHKKRLIPIRNIPLPSALYSFQRG